MTDEILKFLSAFNLQTIFSLFLIVWYFSRHVEKEFKGEMRMLEAKMEKQSERTDRLYEMFIEVVKGRK